MGDRSSEGFTKNRPVLADVSNQLGKRRFVSISSGSGTSTGNENQKSAENEVGKVSFPRRDFVGGENLGKGKCVFEFGGKGDSSVLKAKEISGSWNTKGGAKPLQENVRFGISGVPCQLKAKQLGDKQGNGQQQCETLGMSRISTETKEPSSLYSDNLPFTKEDAAKKSENESDDGSKGSSMSSGLVSRDPGNYDKRWSSVSLVVGEECDEGSDAERTPSRDNTVTNTCGSNGGGMDVGDLTSNKSSSIGGSIPSSGSKDCELEKCAFLNYDGSSNTTSGMDLLKTCSCSFCLKAAYIWSDLQYQDTKGRIAALKRSRKDVRSVIERSSSYGGFGKIVQGNSSKPTQLEHDLMGQWRSLFLHTEDVLIRESSQLQSSLLNLKELRDNCKGDLEMTTATSSYR